MFLRHWLGRGSLAASSQVEARYLCFLTPAIAIFMGLGAARVPKPEYFAPLALTVVWLFQFATARSYWFLRRTGTSSLRNSIAHVSQVTSSPCSRLLSCPRSGATHPHRVSACHFPGRPSASSRQGAACAFGGQRVGATYGNIEPSWAANARSKELFESHIREASEGFSVSRES